MNETPQRPQTNTLESLRAARAWVAEGLRMLRDDLVAMVEPYTEQLPGAVERLRHDVADVLRRMADRVAPLDVVDVEEDAGQEFSAMLSDLGAEAPAPTQTADTTLQDATIRELRDKLQGLRDLGDQLARVTQDKLALAARVEELEAGQGAPSEHAAVARLERKLTKRQEVLERTRERVTWQRAKTDEWKRKAAERWHELRALRKQVKDFERAAGQDAGPASALPKRAPSASRAKRRGTRAS